MQARAWMLRMPRASRHSWPRRNWASLDRSIRPIAQALEPRGHVIIDGNTAAGLGCVYAGATVAAWYPITPSSSLAEAFSRHARGVIEHALRMIVKHTRKEYIYPATHDASSPSTTNQNVPAMGQRLRLKAKFAVPANWTKQEKASAAALKSAEAKALGKQTVGLVSLDASARSGYRESLSEKWNQRQTMR
jgi:TPP-dependent indolepyruvate ferredoxin oxidoreductase alpha subunit